MRIALLVFLVAPTAVHAAYIEGDTGLACYELEYQRRIDRALGSGDTEAGKLLINEGLRTRQCAALPEGLRVRIEENSFPYACVVKFGTVGRCLWVRQRNVNPRE